MSIRLLAVENYRAFAKRTSLEIRPLTLLFGHNSTGKSALVRLLPLIAESVFERGAPLYLSGDVGRGAGWGDLICKARPLRSATVRIEVGFDSPAGLLAQYDILGDVDNRYQYIEKLLLRRGDEVVYRAEFEPGSDQNDTFEGIVPRSTPEGFDEVFDQIGDLPSQVQWISGLRSRPERDFRLSGSPPPRLTSDGRNAAEMLVRGEGERLFGDVASYFHSLDEEVYTAPVGGGRYAIELSRAQAPHVRVNILDTGEGHAQVLAVLVALARARHGGPPVVALEQPELHLHTRAQVALAEQLTQTVRSNDRARLVVETHSEVLLTAVQIALAERRLTPDQVALYWVRAEADGQSVVEPVSFDELGRPTSPALVGMFEEPALLGRKLLQARRRRGA